MITPGTRLENEIMLAGQIGLSRPTMRRAIQYLVDRGLLVARAASAAEARLLDERRGAPPEPPPKPMVQPLRDVTHR